MTRAALEVSAAQYSAGGTTILDGIDLQVAAGEVVGLLGPNGSGKSSLLKAMVGALPTAKLELVADGRDLMRSRSLRARHLALVEQQAPEISLTVHDIVSLGRTPYQRVFGNHANGDQRHVTDAMQRTGTLQFRERVFTTLSGGERQRVLIARALAQTTPFVLLDEPTNHLDLAAQVEILELIDTIAAAGAGVLLAIHDLTQAANFCDRVILLSQGRVVGDGRPPEVLTTRTIKDVFGIATRWLTGPEGSALVHASPQQRRPST